MEFYPSRRGAYALTFKQQMVHHLIQREQKMSDNVNPPIPNRRISEAVAKEIKALLWDGERSQKEIGHLFNVTGASVSNIFRGYQHADVRWPDGSRGAISADRYEHLNWAHGMKRWKRTTEYRALHKPDAEVQRAVNLMEIIQKRIDAGENPDDIKFDDSGNLIERGEK